MLGLDEDRAPSDAELPPRPVLSLFLVLVGLTLVELTAGVTRGLAQDWAFGPSPWRGVVMWSLVLAAVLAIGPRLAL